MCYRKTPHKIKVQLRVINHLHIHYHMLLTLFRITINGDLRFLQVYTSGKRVFLSTNTFCLTTKNVHTGFKNVPFCYHHPLPLLQPPLLNRCSFFLIVPTIGIWLQNDNVLFSIQVILEITKFNYKITQGNTLNIY